MDYKQWETIANEGICKTWYQWGVILNEERWQNKFAKVASLYLKLAIMIQAQKICHLNIK